jgi:hypothetical protein
VPYTVPATPKNNVVEWMTLVTPTGFTKDTWVTSVEIKPSELAVTHHICVSFVPHRPGSQYNTLVWLDKQRDDTGIEVAPTERRFAIPTVDGKGVPVSARAIPTANGGANAGGVGVGFTCYVPGRSLSDFRPYNSAILIPAGSDINWTIHYTPNGTELTDKPEVGLTVAKQEPQRLLIESGVVNDPRDFAIPPNDPNYQAKPAEFTFLVDAELHWMSPHMHLRGKDMLYKLIYPDGREQILLNVPKYDFNWQLGYDLAEPLKVPAGAKLIVIAHYDNSANNKFNPDPNRTVYNGDMTWEEMFAPFFAISVDKSVDPAKVIKTSLRIGGGA